MSCRQGVGEGEVGQAVGSQDLRKEMPGFCGVAGAAVQRVFV